MEHADFFAENAQLWRISDDFWDRWVDIKEQFPYMRNWQGKVHLNAWPDADMLPVGTSASVQSGQRSHEPADSRRAVHADVVMGDLPPSADDGRRSPYQKLLTHP